MVALDYIVATYRLFIILLVCLLMAPLALLCFLLGKSVDWGHHNLRRLWSGSILTLCFIRRRTVAVNRLPQDKSYIFLSNHKSEWDWYLFTHYVPFNWRATIRADLKSFPGIARMAQRLEQIYLVPGGGVESLIRQCKPHLEKGRSILMYPEGRRTRGMHLDEFRIGSFVLAVRYKLPVVPVAIVEENWAEKPGAYGRKFGHNTGIVTIVCGSALYPTLEKNENRAAEKLRERAFDAMLALVKASY